jgi:hypothetical protein
MIKKYCQAWAVVFSITAIASGVFPDPAKADGYPGGKIPHQPPHQSSCEVDDCNSPRRGSLYDEIYSKHKPYCGYLKKNRHHSRHWSENYNRVETSEESSSEKTSFEREPEIREDLIASTEGYSHFSASEPTSSRSRYSQSSTMTGENTLVLFMVILLWFILRPLFSTKDSKKS